MKNTMSKIIQVLFIFFVLAFVFKSSKVEAGVCQAENCNKNTIQQGGCGDGVCSSSLYETESNCPADCGAPTSCGDGVCSPALGETMTNCIPDCGMPPVVCGDGVCSFNAGESCSTCPNDCMCMPSTTTTTKPKTTTTTIRPSTTTTTNVSTTTTTKPVTTSTTTVTTTTTTVPACQFYKATTSINFQVDHKAATAPLGNLTINNWESQAQAHGPSCLQNEIDKVVTSSNKMLNDLRSCLGNKYTDGVAASYAAMMLMGQDMVLGSNTLISQNWNAAKYCSYGKSAYFPSFTNKSECVQEAMVHSWRYCSQSVSYFDSNCNPVDKNTAIAKCGNADFLGQISFAGYMATPISFLWDSKAGISDMASIVDFPLDPSKVGSKWVWRGSEKTPLLVYDPEHKGDIKSATQLFGNWTFGGDKVASLVSSQAKAWRNGYEALKTLDRNQDGEISGEELTPLALWFDKNADSISSSGEVVEASSLGIKKIFFNPDRIDPVTGDIIASVGFEREVEGKIVKGTSVDWQAEGSVNKMELLLKQHLSANKTQNISGEVKEESNYSEYSPADDLKSFGSLTGVWKWSFVNEHNSEKTQNDTGFFVLIEDKNNNTVSGYSMLETPFKNGDKEMKAVLRFRINGNHNKSDSGNRFIFITQADDQNKVENEATVKSDNKMTGVSNTVIKDDQGKTRTLSYRWEAVRYSN